MNSKVEIKVKELSLEEADGENNGISLVVRFTNDRNHSMRFGTKEKLNNMDPRTFAQRLQLLAEAILRDAKLKD